MFVTLFKFIIRVYWSFVPAEKRRNCLFNESCSRHVYQKLEEEGLKSGMAALRLRYKLCRPGYKLEKKEEEWELTLVDGTKLRNEEISEHIRQENE